MSRKKIIMNIVMSIVLVSSVVTAVPERAFAAVSRLGGEDRYETSVEVSKGGWQDADHVVLVSGESYADALCAAPLAKKYSAPILLTDGKTLNEKVKSRISELGVSYVTIVGGNGAVSDSIQDDLKSMNIEVDRVWGADRYETSVAVAKKLENFSRVVIASGQGYADALSIAPVAASQGIPILLTSRNYIPKNVKSYIDSNKKDITSTYVIGGSGVIIDDSVASLPSKIRIGGSDRYETNVDVMKYFKDKINFNDIYVVRGNGSKGDEFADALSASALAAKTSSPVILTYNVLPKCTEDFIIGNVSDNKNVIAVGGQEAVSDYLLSYVQFISKIYEFRLIPGELESIADSVENKNEKNVLLNLSSVIQKAVDSSDFGSDFSDDMDNAEQLLKNLSDSEQVDLYNRISSDKELMQQLQDLDSSYVKSGL
ncbi:cell wall-binding repeat-containing protein [Clostridium sp. LBM24168]